MTKSGLFKYGLKDLLHPTQVVKYMTLQDRSRNVALYVGGRGFPLGPKSDQHQFSPNNISRSSREKVMRITKLITTGRML